MILLFSLTSCDELQAAVYLEPKKIPFFFLKKKSELFIWFEGQHRQINLLSIIRYHMFGSTHKTVQLLLYSGDFCHLNRRKNLSFRLELYLWSTAVISDLQKYQISQVQRRWQSGEGQTSHILTWEAKSVLSDCTCPWHDQVQAQIFLAGIEEMEACCWLLSWLSPQSYCWQ